MAPRPDLGGGTATLSRPPRRSLRRLVVRLEHTLDRLQLVAVESESALDLRPMRLGRYAARALVCELMDQAAEREVARLQVNRLVQGSEHHLLHFRPVNN